MNHNVIIWKHLICIKITISHLISLRITGSWRLAADITFVVSGCLAAIINGFLVFHAIRTENQQIIYHGVPATTHLKQQMDGVNSTSPPASPTNGTNSYQTNQQLTQNVSKKKRPRP